MEEEKIIQNLLTEVAVINKKYDDIAADTGERFNVFEILGLSTNENRTHSAFIAALLNPKSHHGAGTKFLSLFLEEIEFEGFDLESATVKIEQNIGYIPKDYESGGRVDLVITDKIGNLILIENKIYAGDQQKQLYRYYQYGVKATQVGNKTFRVVYLNLNGNAPSEYSTKGDNLTLKSDTHFKVISYKKNVQSWLYNCIITLDTNKASVKESISHYHTLIKNLTGKSIIKNMEQETTNLIISNKEFFLSAKHIKTAYENAKQNIYTQFWEEIQKQGSLSKELEWRDFLITLELDEDNDGFYFGFSACSDNKQKIDNRKEELKPIVSIVNGISNGFKNNEHFIGWKYPNDLRRFFELSDEIIFDLSVEEYRKNYVKVLLEEGEEYWRQFEKRLEEMTNFDKNL